MCWLCSVGSECSGAGPRSTSSTSGAQSKTTHGGLRSAISTKSSLTSWGSLRATETSPPATAFLRGLYDTDGSLERGSVVSLTLTSDRLIHEVQIMLLNLGIVTSNGVKRGRYRGRVHLSRRLVIAGADVERFFDRVGFAVKRKCSLVQPARRNPNVDLIPFVGEQLQAAVRTVTLTREQHDRFYDYRHGRRRPTFAKLTELVGVLERQRAEPALLVPLQEILKRQLLFLPVVSILPGRAQVYDLTVPV